MALKENDLKVAKQDLTELVEIQWNNQVSSSDTSVSPNWAHCLIPPGGGFCPVSMKRPATDIEILIQAHAIIVEKFAEPRVLASIKRTLKGRRNRGVPESGKHVNEMVQSWMGEVHRWQRGQLKKSLIEAGWKVKLDNPNIGDRDEEGPVKVPTSWNRLMKKKPRVEGFWTDPGPGGSDDDEPDDEAVALDSESECDPEEESRCQCRCRSR
jgi:hypothetical protein